MFVGEWRGSRVYVRCMYIETDNPIMPSAGPGYEICFTARFRCSRLGISVCMQSVRRAIDERMLLT